MIACVSASEAAEGPRYVSLDGTLEEPSSSYLKCSG